MRELKFRTWNWLEGRYDKNPCAFLTISGELTPSVNRIIEQYTGLKDKNGKEICDGDILDDGEKHIGKVLYNERLASFAYEWGYCGSTFMNLYTSDMKVIGNIHENAELLGEKE